MRTVTSFDSERVFGVPSSTSYHHRVAAESFDVFMPSSNALRGVAWTKAGGWGIGTNPFAELETVDMMISDTAPADGAVVSSRATSFGNRRSENGFAAGVMIGGSTVADTPSAPLTRCASAAAGSATTMVKSAHT